MELSRPLSRVCVIAAQHSSGRLLCSLTDNDLRIDLAAALESLPAHYLEVVMLRAFEELTIAEIAERLGEQPGAIKSRLHRARELVREYMIGPPPVVKSPKEVQ